MPMPMSPNQMAASLVYGEAPEIPKQIARAVALVGSRVCISAAGVDMCDGTVLDLPPLRGPNDPANPPTFQAAPWPEARLVSDGASSALVAVLPVTPGGMPLVRFAGGSWEAVMWRLLIAHPAEMVRYPPSKVAWEPPSYTNDFTARMVLASQATRVMRPEEVEAVTKRVGGLDGWLKPELVEALAWVYQQRYDNRTKEAAP